jgi:Leucine-rich repeat (LRR) protein
MDLDLGNNHLTSLPTDFGNLERLVYVNLSDNKIEQLPSSIGKCKYISKFQLERFVIFFMAHVASTYSQEPYQRS